MLDTVEDSAVGNENTTIKYVIDHLYVLSTVLFILVVILNFVLLLFRELIVLKYLFNIYSLICALILYLSSNKIDFEFAYKDSYLYSFVIYSIILSFIFSVLNRYFPNLIYRHVYNLMLFLMKYIDIDRSFILYVKYFNVLNTLNIQDNEELLKFLKTYDGNIYQDLMPQIYNRSMCYLSVSEQDDYIVNDSSIVLVSVMHVVVLLMAIQNSFCMTDYFVWGFMALSVMFLNFSIEPKMEFMNKFRHLLLIFGFIVYMIYEMYLYQICISIVLMLFCTYTSYRMDREYFYANSEISFVCKFLYGRYLKFLVFCVTFICFAFIAYMEYMSLYVYINGHEVKNIVATMF